MNLDAGQESATVLVPAYKEAEQVKGTLSDIAEAFRLARKRIEILVVLDVIPGDQTRDKVLEAAEKYDEIRFIERSGRRGVGDAISAGIKNAKGNIVIIAMGDHSEDPRDIVNLADVARFYDIVFTNRFRNGKPQGYPWIKYLANRLCNISAKTIFRIPYSDITNAFKAYRRNTIKNIDLRSTGFEVFLELPIKALICAHRTTEVEVGHVVVKEKIAKFSAVKDGRRYVSLILSFLRSAGPFSELGEQQR